ncbi:hypothetical protein DFH94DRAFT_695128 [Russula ochroleuca]|uniref:DUF6535 domain-containing protein n=1 Tax=Russula ochroleuca TaxID=152965 RepID=A0A9P5T5R6_9AGAM|nr:hypothetical protein DFH94DRAFT_695128 [Russula ochroleuca]
MEFYPKLTTDSSESRNMLIKLAISIWLISLVFAIKTALIALQLQEWVRIYIDTLNVPSRPRCHRALIRLFSFLGVDLYNAPNMVQLISALHVSMCTFSGGLAIVVHTHKINTIVAIAFDRLFSVTNQSSSSIIRFLGPLVVSLTADWTGNI